MLLQVWKAYACAKKLLSRGVTQAVIRDRDVQYVYWLWFETGAGKDLAISPSLARCLLPDDVHSHDSDTTGRNASEPISKAEQQLRRHLQLHSLNAFELASQEPCKFRQLTESLFPRSNGTSRSAKAALSDALVSADIRCYELCAVFTGALPAEATETHLRNLLRMLKDSFL